MNQKITEEHLRRRAIVYVRQSTPIQLIENRESQIRQYGLAEHARNLGFSDVETIDADLGRSGSGLEERPGFQRLVAEVCSGQVGAILCIEASRLARNGRDWHQLFELCGLAGALVIEPDGVYDPRLINDRLLLGLKGIMNEFELTLMRQRSLAAIWQKARRGEYQCRIPVGFCWTEDGRMELDPDRRVQQAVRHVFDKFAELGSVHQVFLSFREEGIQVPFARFERSGDRVEWKPPVYRSLHAVLENPVYAGAYVFGRTESRTIIVDGQARRTANHAKPREQWSIVIPDHHPGYITWEQYERNQKLMAENSYLQVSGGPKGRSRRAKPVDRVAAVWPMRADDVCRIRWEKPADRAVSLFGSARSRAHADVPGIRWRSARRGSCQCHSARHRAQRDRGSDCSGGAVHAPAFGATRSIAPGVGTGAISSAARGETV